MYITSVERVREYDIKRKGAVGVKVKYLLHKGVGAKRLQLRLFTIGVGGYTPLEKHEHEHEVFVLKGRALVRGGDQEKVVQPRNVIFIPSNEEHQFKNIGNEPFQFLCTKETTRCWRGGNSKRRNEEMDATSIKQWIREEILKRGFNGACGVASFSDVYNNLMPLQRKEVERICGDKISILLSAGSIISIAVFHTENAIKSINVVRDGKVDYEKWNVYANEYNRINNVLNDVCAKLTSVLDGVPLRATSELGKKVRSVEEYYPFARISHRVVAEHAGIGARGKNELIVTKQNGPALRLNSFITPRELERDEKVEDLCGDCTACLDSCRILLRKTELRNYRQQCMEKINALNLRYPVCGICVKACYESGSWRKKT